MAFVRHSVFTRKRRRLLLSAGRRRAERRFKRHKRHTKARSPCLGYACIDRAYQRIAHVGLGKFRIPRRDARGRAHPDGHPEAYGNTYRKTHEYACPEAHLNAFCKTNNSGHGHTQAHFICGRYAKPRCILHAEADVRTHAKTHAYAGCQLLYGCFPVVLVHCGR